MGAVVVAVMDRPAEVEPLLRAASRVLDSAGGGRLKALAVRLPPAATIMPTEEVLTTARAATIRAEQDAWTRGLRARVDAWASRPPAQGVRLDWVDVEGDIAAVIADHGRRADAIVIARPVPHDGPRRHDALHAALFDSGCPVLVVPPGFDGPFGRVAAIAWKDDAHAGPAVRASLPLLRQAERVVVLCADAQATVPAVLAEHDIAATAITVPDGAAPAGERILQAARDAGADLLVMGAFAHAEWRERLFGGVTRTMFAQADLPLLMRH